MNYTYNEKVRDLYGYITSYENFELHRCEQVVETATKNDSELANLYTGWDSKPTLLSVACDFGYYTIAEILLKNGANANGDYKAKYGDKTMITPESTPIEIAYKHYRNYNHNFRSSRDSYKETVEILIKYGADESKLSKYNEGYHKDRYLSEEIPLLCGIVSGDLEKISKYLAKGRNVDDFRYSLDKTALMWACKGGNFEAAITLISAGADINAKDINGKTVLNYAAEGGNTKIMELLLAQGAKA